MEDKEESRCPTCVRIATVSLWKIISGGSPGEKGATLGGARSVEKKRLEATKQAFFFVQTGESIEQAKVFQAHAVPQGMCANLINALKLQSVVKNLGKESRKGLTEGLREFVKIDNERALEVGYLNRGIGTLKVRKPKVPEGCPEVTVGENSDEFTLRAEEMGTLKTYINVNHIEEETWCPPWLITTGTPSVRRCIKASKEKTGESKMMLTKT